MHSKKLWIIVSACFLSIILIAGSVVFAQRAKNWKADISAIKITLDGEQGLTVEYGKHFEEPGASAQLLGENGEIQTEEIDISFPDNADTLGPGTHYLQYTAEYDGYVGTAYRKIHIVDTQAPVITLEGDADRYLLPGDLYVEDGFSATDNYDGDITQYVKSIHTKDAVTYSVKDSFGNITTVVRNLLYEDSVPPEITLEQGEMLILDAGAAYSEPGYTAKDNCHGDITDRVKVTGEIDTGKYGRQTVTYTVSDMYGNAASVKRTAFVKDPSVTRINDPNKAEKVIYLTFDDGPWEGTPRLLDILGKYNVQATFFVVNTAYIDTLGRIAEEGHTVAMHTATHNFRKIYASVEAYFEDLYKIEQIIYDRTGQSSKILRFPGGSSNTISRFNYGIMSRLTEAVQEQGYRYFDWNVDSDDAGSARSWYQVYENVVTGIGDKQTAVVLMHDIKNYTIDAVEDIIIWGLNNGYTFLPLTQDSPECHHGVNN